MIKLGTIGTSKITEQFLVAAKKNPNIKITCCYSRSKENAKEFIKRNELTKAKAVDSFQVMVDEIDTVYIASPNGLHYEQAKYFISQQKNVFIEKPIALEFNQAVELAQMAKKNNVMVMEAFKPIHTPQFGYLLDFVHKFDPFVAAFSMNQYSSRMPDIKNGIYNSVFDSKLGKGSTYDMLIYPVELAIALFGAVSEVKAMGIKLPNGVNITDTVLLRHENDVLVTITNSKAAHGVIYSEINADQGTMIFKNPSKIGKIKMYDAKTDKYFKIFEAEEDKSFDYELNVFSQMILENDIAMRDYLLNVSVEAIKVLNMVESSQDKLGEN